MSLEPRREVVLYEAALEPLPVHGALTHLEGRALPYDVWTNRGWFLESVSYGSLDKSIEEAACGGLPSSSFTMSGASRWGCPRMGLPQGRPPRGVEVGRGRGGPTGGPRGRDGMLKWFWVGIHPIRSSWDFVADKEWEPTLGPEHMDRVTRTGKLGSLKPPWSTTPAFATAQVKLAYSSERPPRDRRPTLKAWQSWRASLPDPTVKG